MAAAKIGQTQAQLGAARACLRGALIPLHGASRVVAIEPAAGPESVSELHHGRHETAFGRLGEPFIGLGEIALDPAGTVSVVQGKIVHGKWMALLGRALEQFACLRLVDVYAMTLLMKN